MVEERQENLIRTQGKHPSLRLAGRVCVGWQQEVHRVGVRAGLDPEWKKEFADVNGGEKDSGNVRYKDPEMLKNQKPKKLPWLLKLTLMKRADNEIKSPKHSVSSTWPSNLILDPLLRACHAPQTCTRAVLCHPPCPHTRVCYSHLLKKQSSVLCEVYPVFLLTELIPWGMFSVLWLFLTRTISYPLDQPLKAVCSSFWSLSTQSLATLQSCNVCWTNKWTYLSLG